MIRTIQLLCSQANSPWSCCCRCCGDRPLPSRPAQLPADGVLAPAAAPAVPPLRCCSLPRMTSASCRGTTGGSSTSRLPPLPMGGRQFEMAACAAPWQPTAAHPDVGPDPPCCCLPRSPAAFPAVARAEATAAALLGLLDMSAAKLLSACGTGMDACWSRIPPRKNTGPTGRCLPAALENSLDVSRGHPVRPPGAQGRTQTA